MKKEGEGDEKTFFVLKYFRFFVSLQKQLRATWKIILFRHGNTAP